MAPRPRASHTLWPREDELRPAAVAILLFPLSRERADQEPGLVLTRRPRNMARHQGQVCFPGGAMDQGEGVVEAAVREVHEEVGIPPADCRILGTLTPMVIPVSRFRVTPVVAALAAEPCCRPDPREVEEVYLVPLRGLFSPQARRERTERRSTGPIQIPFYQHLGHEVWGATAMMLAELEAVACLDVGDPR